MSSGGSAITIVGRSSSHYTRIVRIFAHELAVEYELRPVFEITSTDPAAFAGNPAMKVPVLIDANGGASLFGMENICRALVRMSGKPNAILRGEVDNLMVANAEELALHVMSSEVAIIMAKMTGVEAAPKVMKSIQNSMAYLDMHVDDVLSALPASRAISFAETALFCVARHLPFREVMDVTPFKRLSAFCDRFGERESAKQTEYLFDAAPAKLTTPP